MASEKATVPQLADEYIAAIRESAKVGVLVRDTELQLQQIAVLTALKKRLKGFKYGAINARDEQSANALFHMQCGLNAWISFLRMWTEIKEGKYHAAWSSLIDAEEYVSLALRASQVVSGLDDFWEHLKRVESVVFPAFTLFNSWGAVIRGGRCTVCGDLLNDCPHVEGMIYSGRLCTRVHPEIVKLDHMALVEEPHDRRCLINEITADDGYYHDCMTWRRTKQAEMNEEGTAGRFVGTIFSNKLLEVD